MVTMGILPYQGKNPHGRAGIEPETSGLVFRNADHWTTRLVREGKQEVVPSEDSVSLSHIEWKS
jgi:hypothetical protein